MARGFGSKGRVVRSDTFLRSAMGDWGPTVYGLALARTCSPAELLGVRPASVRTRLHRARIKLCETMGGTCDDEQIPDGERGPLHTGLQAR